MSMTDKLPGMTEQEKADHAESEAKSAEVEYSMDEWDIDEISFSDEGEITVEDLKTSPALKIAYGRFISATNWNRWILGC